MIVHTLEVGPMQNLVYILENEATHNAILIDAGFDSEKITAFIAKKELTLVGIVLTHGHYDHVGALPELLPHFPSIPVYFPKSEWLELVPAPVRNHPGLTFTFYENSHPITIQEFSFKSFHTPGHTPGSHCLQIESHLFAGDTLFILGCGRSDLPGGSPQELFHSLSSVIYPMNDNLHVYPGHHYGRKLSDTLGNLKTNNPYLAASSFEQFIGT